MKNKILTLTLSAITLWLTCSCSQINERFDNLEERIDGIESTSIASVQQQIDGIKASITKLEAADVTVNGKIDELKATAEAHQTLIDALKEADETLGRKDEELEGRIATLEGQVSTINGQIKTLEDADKAINVRIDTLKTYVDTEIGKTKDWAEETFATLEQYQQTADDLAALSVTVTGISTTLAGMQTSISGLDTKIDGINVDLQGKITAAKTELEGKITSLKTELEDKIASAISTSETSIKSWINELLEGYYTIAQVDAKIGALNTAIEASKSTAKERIDSVATELTALKTAVDTEKAAIRTEYKNAIDVAINKLDGEIRGALLDSIAAVNGRIEALDTRVTTLEGKVLTLEGNVNKLLAMIQSVSITPAYSDGSVEADENGILTLKCIVSPAEALNGMESLKDSLLLYADSVKVKTKATSAYMEIAVSEAEIMDETQGIIILTTDISGYLPKGENKALIVAVNIKNGISDFTTEFVPVSAPAPVSVTFVNPEGDVISTMPATQYILNGSKASKPSDPTDKTPGNSGFHTLEGWYKTKDATTGELSDKWDFNNVVTENITLYAQWQTTVEKIIGKAAAPFPFKNIEEDLTHPKYVKDEKTWVGGTDQICYGALISGTKTIIVRGGDRSEGAYYSKKCLKTGIAYKYDGSRAIYTFYIEGGVFTKMVFKAKDPSSSSSQCNGTYTPPTK